MSPLIVVTGTGTGIGKTHVALTILRVWSRRTTVMGLKPVESGGLTDSDLLGQASTFHVTRCRPPYMYAAPISPHLGARAEGRAIDLDLIKKWVATFRRESALLVELAGGLFSPLGVDQTNATLAKVLEPTAIVLVAPDRLGVLHDVGAASRAATLEGLVLNGIILSAPEIADASTSTNAREISLVTDIPILASLPRAPVNVLAEREDVGGALDRLVSPL